MSYNLPPDGIEYFRARRVGERIQRRVAATLETPEVKRIEDALDTLLNACLVANKEERARDGLLKTWSGDELAKMTEIDWICRNPVRWAYRKTIRILGKRLYELGHTQLMEKVCGRVAQRDPGNHGRRGDIMDKNWDGIGGAWWS